MKKILPLIAALCLLCGCAQQPPVPSPVQPDDPLEETQPVRPEHSPLYIPGLDVEDVIRYFNEVCLDAEINNSGDPSLLQRWEQPILYRLHGDYDDGDLAVIDGFARWLNTMETPNSFPGFREAEDGVAPNLQIHFCTEAEMQTLIGDWAVGMDGAVTFWYSDNEIYDAIICYRSDLDRELRNSVILEEIFNGLGPIQDTELRPDSIAYAEFSTPQSLTEIDELILQLLYHSDMMCGMDAAQCEALIRELYY